ncbi:MAG: FtsH protease activity modulator HflK [candidate division NC10 bacterium]|nr:FtsH protease activity modulator HflK [Candidatus Rokubacteria bacterium]MBI4390351.1 FtsH protease activity modulator HflK [candidate division NC10 bacterium]
MALDDNGEERRPWAAGGGWEDVRSRLPQLPGISGRFVWVIAGVVALLWLASGFFIVGPGEQGVVRQFGKVIRQTSAGLNYRLPWPIQQADVVNVERIQRLEVGFRSDPRRPGSVHPVTRESLMLTGDENIVDAQIIVQYRIKDPIPYLFRIQDPLGTLRAATEVALRSRVGNTTIDEVLTVGRVRVQEETREFLQQLMDAYESGLLVTEVKLQTVDAPDQVKDAFHDVVRAREDRERLINQARGYREDLIPKARGEAQEVIRAAEAYREERILKARGDAARFESVLAEYRKAPAVTRERLHLETLERVLPGVQKIVLDGQAGGQVVPFLPLRDITIHQQPAPPVAGEPRRGQ